MRIRVGLDVSLSLCRGRVVSLENGKKTWITFKYERLPNICYWCGRLDHNDRDCEIWLESEGSLAENQKQFGPSLRALSFSPARRSVVAVPGFYTPKRKPATPPASATRPEEEGFTSDEPPPMEEQTVVRSLEASVNTLNAQLMQETVDIKEPIQSKNGYSGFKDHVPKNTPYNPEPINIAVDDTFKPENSGASCDSPSTNTGDFILINASNQSIRPNQFQTTATLKPTHPNISHESLAREMHEITRAKKKPSTWTRLDRASTTQKVCPSVSTGACKPNISNVDDHSELPSSKR
ncbi:uncharacterized protein LOC126721499 [Quercus robur]|uniref:uncharacterized protein LOC126721499 n=1 Tax=Quercus robur TaxID=38942 RepID=UPI0021628517|nr:uncharacterized protein LOC126721499 [Quercus robur]